MAQLDMFGEVVVAPPSTAADPDRVRRKLDMLLVEARSAGSHGLSQTRRRLMETIVPQMTRWLPEHEADELRRAFGEALANA